LKMIVAGMPAVNGSDRKHASAGVHESQTGMQPGRMFSDGGIGFR